MQRTGEVTAVHGEMLEVTFCRPADCEKCNACHGGEKVTKLMIHGKAQVGDIAVVEMPTKTVMQASGLAYGLPLAGLMLGLATGTMLFPQNQDIAGVLCGALGLGAMVLFVHLTESKRRNDPRWKPQLIEIIPKKDA
ncbi:MAG: SoxR reducing system RseC family protein [Clostridia bacterium]|nr:SoxR reducing system RseC family protein [Clostridia bacterium]